MRIGDQGRHPASICRKTNITDVICSDNLNIVSMSGVCLEAVKTKPKLTAVISPTIQADRCHQPDDRFDKTNSDTSNMWA